MKIIKSVAIQIRYGEEDRYNTTSTESLDLPADSDVIHLLRACGEGWERVSFDLLKQIEKAQSDGDFDALPKLSGAAKAANDRYTRFGEIAERLDTERRERAMRTPENVQS